MQPKPKNGKLAEITEYRTPKVHMGYSCSAIRGILCSKKSREDYKTKRMDCENCEVYQLYHHSCATKGRYRKKIYTEEDIKFHKTMINRLINSHSFSVYYNM